MGVHSLIPCLLFQRPLFYSLFDNYKEANIILEKFGIQTKTVTIQLQTIILSKATYVYVPHDVTELNLAFSPNRNIDGFA